jgi:hypothetical protein
MMYPTRTFKALNGDRYTFSDLMKKINRSIRVVGKETRIGNWVKLFSNWTIESFLDTCGKLYREIKADVKKTDLSDDGLIDAIGYMIRLPEKDLKTAIRLNKFKDFEDIEKSIFTILGEYLHDQKHPRKVKMDISKLEQFDKYSGMTWDQIPEEGRKLYREICDYIDSKINVDDLYRGESQGEIYLAILMLFKAPIGYNYNKAPYYPWYDYGR